MARGPLRLGVLASGRGTNLQSILDAAAESKIRSRVAVVVSDVLGARVLDRARRSGVPAECVPPRPELEAARRKRTHEDEVGKILRHYRVQVVVLAGYMRLLSPTFVRRYPNRIVNIHPALLPSFPGLHAQAQALDWGVRVAGCTTHFVDAQTDHGPIILQAAVAVDRRDTQETLSRRILQVEHQILPRTIHLLERGRVRVEGRHVRIDPDPTWATKYPRLPGVLYGEGY